MKLSTKIKNYDKIESSLARKATAKQIARNKREIRKVLTFIQYNEGSLSKGYV